MPAAPDLAKAIEEIVIATNAGEEGLSDAQLLDILDTLHARFPDFDTTPDLCHLIAKTFKAHLAARAMRPPSPDRVAPKLLEHYERIKSDPRVKAYYAKHGIGA